MPAKGKGKGKKSKAAAEVPADASPAKKAKVDADEKAAEAAAPAAAAAAAPVADGDSKCNGHSHGNGHAASAIGANGVDTSGIAADQLAMLNEEFCIVVDREDRPLRPGSKLECHLMSNINGADKLLHRAFSVFLFNSKGELLLQQRADCKPTFRNRWTNTCCSHPLHVPAEMEEANAVGVRRAAQRKLEHELGIPRAQAPIDKMVFLTRIHYLADSDGTPYGEHEIDHILFMKADVDMKLNDREVRAVQWVTPDKLKALFAEAKQNKSDIFITPWFEHIANQFLFEWWGNLDKILADGGIGAKEAATIHRMGV